MGAYESSTNWQDSTIPITAVKRVGTKSIWNLPAIISIVEKLYIANLTVLSMLQILTVLGMVLLSH